MDNSMETLETEQCRKLAKNASQIFIIGMASRPGARLFSVTLEYKHFRPGTLKNADYQFYVVKWPEEFGMYFGVIQVDYKYLDLVHEVAEQTGMRLTPGSPSMLSGETWETFPFHNENPQNNIFTLENEPESQLYKSMDLGTQSDTRESMLSFEDMLIQQIFAEQEDWVENSGEYSEEEDDASRELTQQRFREFLGE